MKVEETLDEVVSFTAKPSLERRVECAMDREQEYRREAEELEKQAAGISDELMKRRFLQLAEAWRRLAEGVLADRRRGL